MVANQSCCFLFANNFAFISYTGFPGGNQHTLQICFLVQNNEKSHRSRYTLFPDNPQLCICFLNCNFGNR